MAEKDDAPSKQETSNASDKGKPKRRRKSTKMTMGSTPRPKIKDMVEEAIGLTHDPSGSSLQAIKKYLADNYGFHQATYIRSAVKRGVSTGEFIQVKGVGASGSFKLNTATNTEPVKTNRQKDSDKAKQRKDAKSEQEARRIARKAQKLKEERQAKREESTKVKERLAVKPAKPVMKAKSRKKTEKKKNPVKKLVKKSPKARKGSKSKK